jgi:hypothetical protein
MMFKPPKQTPNRRCAYCGEGCVCQHGYCEFCMPCAECVVEEDEVAGLGRGRNNRQAAEGARKRGVK